MKKSQSWSYPDPEQAGKYLEEMLRYSSMHTAARPGTAGGSGGGTQPPHVSGAPQGNTYPPQSAKSLPGTTPFSFPPPGRLSFGFGAKRFDAAAVSPVQAPDGPERVAAVAAHTDTGQTPAAFSGTEACSSADSLPCPGGAVPPPLTGSREKEICCEEPPRPGEGEWIGKTLRYRKSKTPAKDCARPPLPDCTEDLFPAEAAPSDLAEAPQFFFDACSPESVPIPGTEIPSGDAAVPGAESAPKNMPLAEGRRRPERAALPQQEDSSHAELRPQSVVSPEQDIPETPCRPTPSAETQPDDIPCDSEEPENFDETVSPENPGETLPGDTPCDSEEPENFDETVSPEAPGEMQPANGSTVPPTEAPPSASENLPGDGNGSQGGSRYPSEPEPQNSLGPSRRAMVPEASPTGRCIPGVITNTQGLPVESDCHSLAQGYNAPVMLRDTWLCQKLAHFVREALPPRPVCASGAGAFGSFVCLSSLRDYSCSCLWSEEGHTTHTLVRFSRLFGLPGSAESLRDARGMAVKFYGSQGNTDLISFNIPAAPVADAMRLPDLFHAVRPAPDRGFPESCRFWEYYAASPEVTNFLSYLYGTEGLQSDWRCMDTFCPFTLILVNAQGRRTLARPQWISRQGVRSLSPQQAKALAAKDPYCASRALWNALECGETVRYDLGFQMMTPEQAERLEFNPCDPTKLWPEERFPVIVAGTLTLDENPQDYFSQVEQAAFTPGSLSPGIELSEDRLLAGAVFAAPDSARHRIGGNYAQLIINRPVYPPVNTLRQGAMNTEYGPAFDLPAEVCAPDPGPYRAPNIRMQPYPGGPYTQAGEHFRSLDSRERFALADNIAQELYSCPEPVIKQCLAHFLAADQEWSRLVAERIAHYTEGGADPRMPAKT